MNLNGTYVSNRKGQLFKYNPETMKVTVQNGVIMVSIYQMQGPVATLLETMPASEFSRSPETVIVRGLNNFLSETYRSLLTLNLKSKFQSEVKKTGLSKLLEYYLYDGEFWNIPEYIQNMI